MGQAGSCPKARREPALSPGSGLNGATEPLIAGLPTRPAGNVFSVKIAPVASKEEVWGCAVLCCAALWCCADGEPCCGWSHIRLAAPTLQRARLLIAACPARCPSCAQAEYNRVTLQVNEQGEIVAPAQGNVGILGLTAVRAFSCNRQCWSALLPPASGRAGARSARSLHALCPGALATYVHCPPCPFLCCH